MSKRHISVAIIVMCIGAGLPSPILAGDSPLGPAINYVSADAVYVNVGTQAGLAVGAQIKVLRNGKRIAVIEVVNVSSHSAMCRIVSQTESPRVDDTVFFKAERAQQPVADDQQQIERPREKDRRSKDRLRGSISIYNTWQRDLDGSELSSYQPGINGRLTVDDILGLGGVMRIRHRTRFYHRTRPLSTEPDTDEWAHRLSEFGVYFNVLGEPDAIGFGRVLNPHIRGLGYMDGGFVSIRIHPHFYAGMAGGLDPDIENSSVQSDHQKYGAFIAYESGSPAERQFSTTVAWSGSYNEGTINREFGYIQGMLSFARRMSIYHSMEVDINRGWRKDAEGHSLSFSNAYFMANLALTQAITLDALYDARRNVRDYHVHDSPDSLFDESMSTGYSGGISLSLPLSVQIRARGGVRLSDYQQSNRHGSVSINARHFLVRGHSVLARLSVSETPYITGYRPTFTYRFPVTRRTRLSAGLGAYVFKQGTQTTISRFGQLGFHHTLSRRYYVSGNARRIAGDSLDSAQLFLEAGMSF